MRIDAPDPDLPLNASWLRPLDLVTTALRQPLDYLFQCLFDPHDLMIMAKVVRSGRPDIVLYKHRLTRSYLNLDDVGGAYRYVHPRDLSSTRTGQYRRHADLKAAIIGLRLWDLLDMEPDLERLHCHPLALGPCPVQLRYGTDPSPRPDASGDLASRRTTRGARHGYLRLV